MFVAHGHHRASNILTKSNTNTKSVPQLLKLTIVLHPQLMEW